MEKLGGKATILNRSDINTDEIIPARYLTEVDKKSLAPHLLEDLELDGFDPNSDSLKSSKVVVSKENFGCGSSREHAVWVFTENNFQVIIAQNFARIFRQNAYNSGLLAIELPEKEIDKLLSYKNLEVIADLDNQKLQIKHSSGEEEISFDISPFYKAVVKAGGWINYAKDNY